MIEPRWSFIDQVLRLLDIQILRYGGQPGVRGQGLLEFCYLPAAKSAHYEELEDLVGMATTYAVAISGNHPFFDGNKRTAFFAVAFFLEVNGFAPALCQ